MLLHILWCLYGNIKETVDLVNVAVMWETGVEHNVTEDPKCCAWITAEMLSPSVKENNKNKNCP